MDAAAVADSNARTVRQDRGRPPFELMAMLRIHH